MFPLLLLLGLNINCGGAVMNHVNSFVLVVLHVCPELNLQKIFFF